MRMIRGDEGGEKARSVREAEQPGDGEIFVEVRPVDPEPAADQLPALAGLGRRIPEPGNHSSGTVSERPSPRCTTSASGMNSTPRARASGALTSKDFMPPLHEGPASDSALVAGLPHEDGSFILAM